MANSVRISIIVPVYNEESNIDSVFGRINDFISSNGLNDCEVICVNDGSADSSLDKLRNINFIKVVNHVNNQGYGAAIKTGIKHAKGDWIAIVDCDGTYPIENFPLLLSFVGEYDMVVGARTGARTKIPFLRRPAKFFLNQLANYLSGMNIPDLNSGFRIFRKEIALRFLNLIPDGFSFTTTITLACLTNSYKVKYVEINYEKRGGKSSIRPIRDFINFLILIVRIIIYFKPLNVFIPASTILFLIGFAKLFIDFVRLNHFGLGAVMTILVSVQLFFLGLVADLIIRRTSL